MAGSSFFSISINFLGKGFECPVGVEAAPTLGEGSHEEGDDFETFPDTDDVSRGLGTGWLSLSDGMERLAINEFDERGFEEDLVFILPPAPSCPFRPALALAPALSMEEGDDTAMIGIGDGTGGTAEDMDGSAASWLCSGIERGCSERLFVDVDGWIRLVLLLLLLLMCSGPG